MQIFLVRHGEAVEERVDMRRPLSERGVAEVRKVAQYLRGKGARIEIFFHSTKERARQTADIIRRELNPQAPLEEKKYLAPMDAPDEALKELGQLTKSALIAGHMPFLAHLVNRLTSREQTKDGLRFETGTLVILDQDSLGKWIISETISPRGII